MMSHLLECKRIGNANVMFYMQFDAEENGAGPATPCSQLASDKWLSLGNWSAVFDELETFAVANMKSCRPDDITILAASVATSSTSTVASSSRYKHTHIQRTPLSYSAEWLELSGCPLGKLAARLLTQAATGSNLIDLHPYFVNVRVRRSAMDKFARHQSELEAKIKDLQYRLKKRSSSSVSSVARSTAAPTPSVEGKSTTKRSGSQKSVDMAHAMPDIKEEQVASKATDTVTAKPPKEQSSTVENGNKKKTRSESSAKPSTSSSSAGAKETKTTRHSPSASKRSGDRKRTLSSDMFADDDDVVIVPDSQSQSQLSCESMTPATADSSEAVNGRPQRSRKALHANLSENKLSPHYVPVVKRPKSDAEASRATAKPKAAPSKLAFTKDKPRQKSGDPKESLMSPESYLCRLSVPEMEALGEKRRAEIEEMKEMCERMKPEPLPDVKVVDLKHLKLQQIEDRFEDSRPDLQRIFDRFCKGQMAKIERPRDMSEFASNYLLSEQQRLQMMDVLTQNFGGAENLGKYDDLFWNRMLPEWCLALFMHQYKMTRSEATERMAQQEKILQANFRMDDTMEDAMDEFVSTLRRK